MLAAAAALILTTVLPGTTFSVDPSASSVRFEIVHKLHHVDGTSSDIEGKAVAKDDGTVLAMIRIPVASFRSGDANRDAHMIEVLEAGKYPFVVLKGMARLSPGSELPSGPITMQGELDFHGTRHPIIIPITVEGAGSGSLRVRGTFDVSLAAYRVERPSLLFVKVEDDCRIHVDLALRGDHH